MAKVSVLSGTCRVRRLTVVLVSVLVFFSAVCSLAAVGATARERFEDISSWLDAGRRGRSYMPGYTAMSERMRDASENLTPEEIRKLWEDWRTAQKPSITVEEMAEIAHARRDAIDSARIMFSVTEEKLGEDGEFHVTSRTRETFLMDRDKLKTVRQRIEGSQALDETAAYVNAYDGTVRRTFNAETGQVNRFQGRVSFFDPHGPLRLQMLLDAEYDLEMPDMLGGDLAGVFGGSWRNLAAILEEPETVRGRKTLVCVSGSVPSLIVWLDPERGFAILRSQVNLVSWDGNLPTSSAPMEIREAEDFVDCGNGIWMPMKTTIVTFSRDEPGKVVRRVTTQVSEIKINVPIDDAEFTDIFPPGTKVYDGVAGQVYFTGTVEDAELDLTEALEELELDIPLPAAEVETKPEVETKEVAAEPAPEVVQETDRPQRPYGAVVIAALAIIVGLALLAARRRRGDKTN